MFETVGSEISKRTFFESQVVSFVDLTLVHEVVDADCVCLVDDKHLVSCELEVLEEEIDHIKSFLIWHSFGTNVSLCLFINLCLLCDYDNKHLWPNSWSLVHETKTSSKVT